MNISTRVEDAVQENMMSFAQATFIDRYPDIRDGLKPVHRKILITMHKMGLFPRSAHKKSAKIVGTCMGDYHPHGDISTYAALVAMAQSFTLNNKLIDGQGNFGNILGDSCAAQRYTESRLSSYSNVLLKDLSEEAILYVSNYDGSTTEPTVLPSRLPNLLVNGSYSIGGAAFNCSIPSHNLNDVVDITIAVMKNPKLSAKEISKKLLPDFPFGGIITNIDEIRNYYADGTPTSIKMKAKWTIDENKRQIIITELPWMVSANHIKNQIEDPKKFPKLKDFGIESVLTECTESASGEFTMKLIIGYMKNTNPHKLMDTLESKTSLVKSNPLIFTGTLEGKLIENCGVKLIFTEWIKFRREVVRRILLAEIQKLYREMHVLEALIRCYPLLDDIIKDIKKSNSKDDVVNMLMVKYKFSVLQAKAVSGMKLYELGNQSKEQLQSRYNEIKVKMDEIRAKLSPNAIDDIIIEDLLWIKQQFGRKRRTELSNTSRDIINTVEEVPQIPLVLTLNSDSSISLIRSDVMLDKTQMRIFGFKTVSVKEAYRYNTADELFVISNYGIMYRVNEVNDFIRGSLVASDKWETLPKLKFPYPNEFAIALCPIPRSDWEERQGSICILFKNSMLRRIDIKHLGKRLTVKGLPVYTPNIDAKGAICNDVLRVKYFSKDYGDTIAYANDLGEIHCFPENFIIPCGKTTSGIQISPNIENEIKDITICKSDGAVMLISLDGYARAMECKDIPQKKRTTKPYKVFGKFKHKPVNTIVELARMPKNDVWIFTSSGYCILLHPELCRAALAGNKLYLLDGILVKNPGEIVSSIV